VLQIIAALEEHFGVPRPERVKDPLSELVFTILSQNTTDKNRDRAYDNLKRHFYHWEDVMAATAAQIEEQIRVGGLGPQKSKRIKTILTEIVRRRGELSLDYLRDLDTDDARHELLSFVGVGEKTAAIVLLFSLGKPAFPVDTHVLRVTKRLGLVPEKADATKAHRILGDLVPSEKYYPSHINLIHLGKTICRPKNPRCPECPLLTCCPYGRELVKR
jgi:endonuclease-3